MEDEIKVGHITLCQPVGESTSPKKSKSIFDVVSIEIAKWDIPEYITKMMVWFEGRVVNRYYTTVYFPNDVCYYICTLDRQRLLELIKQVTSRTNHFAYNENYIVLRIENIKLDKSKDYQDSIARSGKIVHNPDEFHLFPFEEVRYHNAISGNNNASYHYDGERWGITVTKSIGVDDEWKLPDCLNDMFKDLHDNRYTKGVKSIQDSFKNLMDIKS